MRQCAIKAQRTQTTCAGVYEQAAAETVRIAEFKAARIAEEEAAEERAEEEALERSIHSEDQCDIGTYCNGGRG